MEPTTVAAGDGAERATTVGKGYVDTEDGTGIRLWVAPGSFAYSLAADRDMRGCLYRVAQPSE
eukprot:1305410-Prymnesium_polylepis.1